MELVAKSTLGAVAAIAVLLLTSCDRCTDVPAGGSIPPDSVHPTPHGEVSP